VNTQAENSFNFFFLLSLLTINFLCHFSDLLFLMYLKSLIYFNLLCNLSCVHSPPFLVLSFFILSWFFSIKLRPPLSDILYLACVCLPCLWLIFLPQLPLPSFYSCPMHLVFITIHFLLAGNHLSYFSIFASPFNLIAFFHCHSCHNFSTTQDSSDLDDLLLPLPQAQLWHRNQAHPSLLSFSL
jgi:hypothetical protein